MYAQPIKGDLDRNLSMIMHSAHQRARAERFRLTSEFAARGMGQSTSLIGAAIGVLDTIHKDAIAEAMPIIRDFAERMHVTVAEIVLWARPHLENLGNSVLAELPPAGVPVEHQRIRRQYAQVFHLRLDGALRDIEIGFIGGRSLVIKDSDRRAIVLQKFYDERHSKGWGGLPVAPAASKEEQIITANICQQLSQNGLIEWKGLGGEPVGMGRITARGIDVIEGNAIAPIAITIDSRQFSVHGSSNVQIGDGNAQDIKLNAERIVAAINNSSATAEEKEKAKSIWQSLLDNPLLAKALGIMFPGSVG
ncbi:MAG: hypothetical protein ACLPID_11775 [Beijerinckiaceae bacterium]